ncbi:MAG: hypothetical protein CMJ18_13405 [Phycisphaeraceae bacterium]|nr:hypothetical protein [Phycisphaeraceae bacterium]
MKTRVLLLCAVVATAGLTVTGAHAAADQLVHIQPNPRLIIDPPFVPLPRPITPGDQVAKRCAEAVTKRADRGVDRMGRVTRRCIAAIERMIASGRERPAHRTARRCARTIDRIANSTNRAIKRICKKCVRRLERMNDAALADRVMNVCEEQTGRVNDARDRALTAIRDALAPVSIESAVR